MIIFIGLLLIGECATKDASSSPIESESTDPSARVTYDRAIDRTVSAYHAQRKAVMDRYYARQREIVEKFSGRDDEPRAAFNVTASPPTSGNETTPTGDSKSVNGSVASHEGGEKIVKATANEAGSDRGGENGNSSVSWIYRSSNWNPRELENASDVDLQSATSNNLERSVVGTKVAGYYKLGEFKGSEDEKVLYQHNLGVGLKGSSQLDATFEVVLEGSFAITVVEAFPYANTRANLSWVDGGPGSDYVKLKLGGYENEGFSYTVKVWGVPK